jgi:hypothetical protein
LLALEPGFLARNGGIGCKRFQYGTPRNHPDESAIFPRDDYGPKIPRQFVKKRSDKCIRSQLDEVL